MSKINITNALTMMSLDLIKNSGKGDAYLTVNVAPIFKVLFLNHLNFDTKNPNWVNRDRIVFSNSFMPLMYSCLHLFKKTVSLDDLQEYGKYNANLEMYPRNTVKGIDISSLDYLDIFPTSVGITLGERYLSNLIKKDKTKIIDFNTYVICNKKDLMSGLVHESLSFVKNQKLNKYIIICNCDDFSKDSSLSDTFDTDLEDLFTTYDFEIIKVKNGASEKAIDNALEDAKCSKKPCIVLVNNIYGKSLNDEGNNKNYNTPLKQSEYNNLVEKYKYNGINENIYLEINNILEKRMSKILARWKDNINKYKNDSLIKNVLNIMTYPSKLQIEFNPDNIKLNDNYKESILIGNKKIFNILANKSPFVLSGSDDNFLNTLNNINKSEMMSYKNPLGKNIFFGYRTNSFGYIASGLASLGLKVFISTPIINLYKMMPSVNFNALNGYGVNYIFSNSTYADSYEGIGINPIYEQNILKNNSKIITFTPGDINEIIGTYNIIKDYNKTTAIILSNKIEEQLKFTNYKYVVAGAYRIRKEKDVLKGIIITEGGMLRTSLQVAEYLVKYNLDMRVVSMPSIDLFKIQNEKYRTGLIPKDIPIFVLTETDNTFGLNFTKNDSILGVNKQVLIGTKEELNNELNLTLDKIIASILNVYNNND